MKAGADDLWMEPSRYLRQYVLRVREAFLPINLLYTRDVAQAICDFNREHPDTVIANQISVPTRPDTKDSQAALDIAADKNRPRSSKLATSNSGHIQSTKRAREDQDDASQDNTEAIVAPTTKRARKDQDEAPTDDTEPTVAPSKRKEIVEAVLSDAEIEPLYSFSSGWEVGLPFRVDAIWVYEGVKYALWTRYVQYSSLLYVFPSTKLVLF